MNGESRERIQEANRRAAWRWGGLVVSLLGLQVIGGILAIMLATGDASVAVVPDYHQKALDWDNQVALRSASRALGWTCEVSQIEQSQGVAGLRIRLADRNGKPIDLSSGELQIYRHARASEVRRIKIPAGSVGLLELGQCFDATGLWQVSLDVNDRSGNRFTHSSELDVGSGDSLHSNTPEAS